MQQEAEKMKTAYEASLATAIGEVIMINEVCQVLFCSPNIG